MCCHSGALIFIVPCDVGLHYGRRQPTITVDIAGPRQVPSGGRCCSRSPPAPSAASWPCAGLPQLPTEERDAAHWVAAVVGVPVVEVVTREGEREAHRRNGPDRCFHCKDELFTRISDEVIERHGLGAPVGRTSTQHAGRTRPGARAATAHAVLRPLADAGLTRPQCGASPARSAYRAPTNGVAVPRLAHPTLRRG